MTLGRGKSAFIVYHDDYEEEALCLPSLPFPRREVGEVGRHPRRQHHRVTRLMITGAGARVMLSRSSRPQNITLMSIYRTTPSEWRHADILIPPFSTRQAHS